MSANGPRGRRGSNHCGNHFENDFAPQLLAGQRLTGGVPAGRCLPRLRADRVSGHEDALTGDQPSVVPPPSEAVDLHGSADAGLHAKHQRHQALLASELNHLGLSLERTTLFAPDARTSDLEAQLALLAQEAQAELAGIEFAFDGHGFDDNEADESGEWALSRDHELTVPSGEQNTEDGVAGPQSEQDINHAIEDSINEQKDGQR